MNIENISYLNIDYLSNFITLNFEFIIISLFVITIVITSIFMKNIEKRVTLKTSEIDGSEKYLKLLSGIRELMEITKKDSYRILAKANEESLEILKSNLNLSDSMNDLIRRKAEIVKKNYLQELKKSSLKLSEQFKEEYSKEFANSLKELKMSDTVTNKKILDEANNLMEDIHLHLNSNHDLILKKLDEDMLKTEEFLTSYRKAKIEEFEKEFRNIVNFYIKGYLKRTLSFEEHEEIIRNIMKEFEKSIK